MNQRTVPLAVEMATEELPRCLACGRPIATGQETFRIRGLVLHLACVALRRRRLRGGA